MNAVLLNTERLQIRKLKASDWRSICLIADDFKKRLGFELQGTEKLSFHKDENGNDLFFTGGNFFLKV